MEKIYHYKVTAKVENELGVLARMAILLRKFNINIHSLDAEALADEENFSNIHITLDSDKEDIYTVIKKLERLVPVISVNYERKEA